MAEKEKLFFEFQPVLTDEWEKAISADLKGRDYSKSLIWDTDEGFKVLPYYRRENLEGIDHLYNLPGVFPFVRGNQKYGNKWLIRQDIVVKDVSEANQKAVNLLNKGINSLGFIFKSEDILTKDNISVLLDNICLGTTEINLICPPGQFKYPLVFNDYVVNNNFDRNLVYVSCSADPLGSYVLTGKSVRESISKLSEVIQYTEMIPGLRIITVHGTSFANSGSSLVQEVAFSLAQAAEYLVHLTDKGLDADKIAGKIKFNLGIGGSYFPEIAKLRAARLLWAQITKAFGVDSVNSSMMIIHSETNLINKTIYDPHVNLLRTQTEAMSAVLGGAHSVTVRPFDIGSDEQNEFSERIARNQQILLRDESHLDKVADPGGGSYYIENLTASIAGAAWDLFLKVQDEGGFLNAFKNGFIQSEIKLSADRNRKNYSSRKTNILGVTNFPNMNEKKTGKIDDALFNPKDLSSEESDTETLKPFRYAQPFEYIRYKTDLYSLNGKRPSVFILPVGNVEMRRARAQFSINFFAVAGFEVTDHNGFDSINEGVVAAKEKKADIIVLCSSDDEYAVTAPQLQELLGNEILVVAGNPACRPDLEEKGIRNFIHIRSNITEELSRYQDLLTN